MKFNPVYVLGNLKVVVSEGLGLSLLFSASFLMGMHITAHKSKYVTVRVHEQFWCPSVLNFLSLQGLVS